MKHILKFNESDKSTKRYKIEDNMVVSSGLPTPSKDGEIQEVGFDPNQMCLQGSNAYNYTTTINDIDDKESKQFINKHVKSFNEWVK